MLSDDTWFHKLLDPVFGHPETKPYKTAMKAAIRNPEYVYASVRDSRSKLFFAKLDKGAFSGYFLVVVVKYVKEQTGMVGYVSTAMINRLLPKHNTLLWQHKAST